VNDNLRTGLQTVLQSVHTYPLPDPDSGFDPVTAPNCELVKYGLLERPDATADPDLLDFWQQMFSASPDITLPKFPDIRELFGEYGHIAADRLGQLRHNTHRTSSRNWSGAYITPIPRPNRFVQVIGGWTVPFVDAPKNPPSGVDPANTIYFSSTWIGIGGQRSYNSLPQIGTRQYVTLNGGHRKDNFEAWWQWWIKDRKGYDVPILIQNFDVQPDDGILASVTAEAPTPGDAHFILMNQRTRQLITFKVRAPANIVRLGTTAEWIHERPSKHNHLYPLPHCTDVNFRHCMARNAPDFGTPTILQKLDQDATLSSISEVFEAPHRSAQVSVPKRTGHTSLRIRYREPGT
jgi:Peptidase A4 family